MEELKNYTCHKKWKRIHRNHFDSNFELESILKLLQEKDFKKISKEYFKKYFYVIVRQEKPLGLGRILVAKKTLKK